MAATFDISSFLGRLLFATPGTGHLQADLERVTAQRDALRATTHHLRAQIAGLRAERKVHGGLVRQLRTALDEAQDQRAEFRGRLGVLRRRFASRQPDPEVLRSVITARRDAKLGHDDTARIAREMDFARRSSSYRAAVAAADPGGAERHRIDGLSWWVPADACAVDVAGAPRPRRLPFDEILSTRELAVGRTMLDIGANIGTMSITRAVLGDFDHVYAAEPDPLNYECLVRNILDNGVRGRVLADRVAIGDREGEMYLQRGHSLTHHLLPGAPRDLRPSVVVPCLTLDAWLQKLGLAPGDIDFVKTDTQGWDARVLAGARGLLEQRHIAWEVEFSPSMLRRARSGVGELYDLARMHFTHFIDLRAGDGRRVRPTTDMPDALKYVQEHRARYTNLLLFNTGS